MATKSSKKPRKGAVSLAEEDRRFLDESLGSARARGAGDVDEGGVFEALERFGLSSDRVQRLRSAINDLDVRESVDKASEYLVEQIENARDYARTNPKKVIGGAAGVLVGASLLALAVRRAAGEEKRKTASSGGGAKKSPAKKSSAKKSSAKKSSTKKR